MILSYAPLIQCQSDKALSSKASESCVHRLIMSSCTVKAHVAQHPYCSTDEAASLKHQGTSDAGNDKLLWHVQKEIPEVRKQIDTLITACDTGITDWEAADAAAKKDIEIKAAEIARVRLCSHPSCFKPYAKGTARAGMVAAQARKLSHTMEAQLAGMSLAVGTIVNLCIACVGLGA